MYVYVCIHYIHRIPLSPFEFHCNSIVSPLLFLYFLFRLVKSLLTILITKCMCIYIYICPLFPAYMCRDTCIYCWYANHPSYPILEA